MSQFNSEKLLRHLDRIVEWRTTGLSRPITYEIDMTNICNSRCPFCFGFLSREKDTSSFSLEEVREVIRQIRDFGGKGLTFTGGGEPLCNPATVDAVRYAKEQGLDVGFISNGILLSEEVAEVLVKHCTWIRVSFDAGTKEVYRLTHGLDGDTFERVVRNTRNLTAVKRRTGSDVCIGTGFLTFPEVVGDMAAYVRLSRDAGVDYAQFRPLLKSFNQKEFNRDIDAAMLESLEACGRMSTEDFRVLCSIHKYDSMRSGTVERGYGACHGHNFATVISANKKMYLCCHMRGLDRYCIGDLGTQSLAEIWSSERRRQVFENIDFKDCPLLCRCDGFNTILWKVTQQAMHENFL